MTLQRAPPPKPGRRQPMPRAADLVAADSRVDRTRRQYSSAESRQELKPLRDRNLWLVMRTGQTAQAKWLSQRRNERLAPIRAGSWVYGEELNQTTAICVAHSKRSLSIVLTRSRCPTIFLQLDQTGFKQDGHRTYPKAGVNNRSPTF